MSVSIAILPKAGLTSPDYERLGRAIRESLPALPAAEPLNNTAPGAATAIDDLLAGEMPMPLHLRVMGFIALQQHFGEEPIAVAPSQVVEALKRQPDFALGDLVDVAAVHLEHGGAANDATIRGQLDAILPSELIDEVRIIRS